MKGRGERIGCVEVVRVIGERGERGEKYAPFFLCLLFFLFPFSSQFSSIFLSVSHVKVLLCVSIFSLILSSLVSFPKCLLFPLNISLFDIPLCVSSQSVAVCFIPLCYSCSVVSFPKCFLFPLNISLVLPLLPLLFLLYPFELCLIYFALSQFYFLIYFPFFNPTNLSSYHIFPRSLLLPASSYQTFPLFTSFSVSIFFFLILASLFSFSLSFVSLISSLLSFIITLVPFYSFFSPLLSSFLPLHSF